jgi:hypothetical protein
MLSVLRTNRLYLQKMKRKYSIIIIIIIIINGNWVFTQWQYVQNKYENIYTNETIQKTQYKLYKTQ